jgi:16S rRNA (guanine527-N7)-methyltransferase
LFHVKPVLAAARYVGITLDAGQLAKFERYRWWLETEAAPAGGIGPDELDRLERRHLADSLLFATGLTDRTDEVWDLGTGVGLPGIPLAIALPRTAVLLIDRSQRRVDLLRRVTRIIDLENCQVLHGEIGDLDGKADAIVSRASLSPETLAPIVARHLRPGGIALVGGSWQRRPEDVGWETIEIPADVLDQTIWLLMMRQA